SSKTVLILIRGYPKNRYNAVIFNQRYKSYNKLSDLTLNKNLYVKRVAYQLKKWAGQYYTGKAGPPYICKLCEGCKQGYC
ncbi:hypothetical protein GQ53DRAFT_651354, partial [Thozetella sp. PMI_491]